VIFFSSSVCGKCKSAIERGARRPAKGSGQDALDQDEVDKLLEEGQRARGYLETFNSNPDYDPANSVFLLPSADEKLVPQREALVEELRQHIIAEAKKACELGPPEQDPLKREDTAQPSNRLSAACTVCRGQCCFTGLASHAFLDADGLRAPLFDHPDMRAQELADFYLDLLPQKHVADSCLYHASTGCALPRWARAELCGTYLCDTVVDFLVGSEDLCSNHAHLVVANADNGATEAILHSDLAPVPVKAFSKKNRTDP